MTLIPIVAAAPALEILIRRIQTLLYSDATPVPGVVLDALHTVPLTHRNLCASARSTGAALALGPQDRCLNLATLSHMYGLCMVLASLAAGASVASAPEFDAGRFSSWLDACRTTWYVAGPAMHQAILVPAAAHRAVVERRPVRLSRLGASPLPPWVLRDLERTFDVPVIEAYGLTEAAPLLACKPLPPRPRKPGSIGLAAGVELAILGSMARPCPTGRPGR